jgi:Arc/MetJ-type ribon-helix-helix transcriptional regulator
MATNETTTTVQAQIPAGLLAQMEALVEAGWFTDLNDLLLDALRHYLESRRPELIERFTQADVEWGLHGTD